MSQDDDRDYEVGYKKPPKSTRFKKGQSGNPEGRPKAPKSFAEVVERILTGPFPGQADDGKPSQEVVLRRAVVDAMNGDQRAFAFIIAKAKRCRLIVPIQPDDDSIGLLVPGVAASEEEWERDMKLYEAWLRKKREQGEDGLRKPQGQGTGGNDDG